LVKQLIIIRNIYLFEFTIIIITNNRVYTKVALRKVKNSSLSANRHVLCHSKCQQMS